MSRSFCHSHDHVAEVARRELLTSHACAVQCATSGGVYVWINRG